MNLGFYSYLGAAIAFTFFALLLLFSWRNSLQGKLLTTAVIVSAVWAGLAANLAQLDDTAQPGRAYPVLEVLRYVTWYAFLLKLFGTADARLGGYRRFVGWAFPLSLVFAFLLIGLEWVTAPEMTGLGLTGHLLLAIFGLAIIEQIYRNTSVEHRWAMKYLLLGAGGIFAFDFFLYANALLFRGVDPELWEASGIVNLVAVPLLAIAAARNKNWSLNVFVSRDIVLSTTAIVGGGLYLLVMAGAGYYLREFGGNWGQITQIMFFSLAVVLLAAVMFSAQVRARARVFLAKHFYANKYDYRREWLKLTAELSQKQPGKERFETAIRALAQIVDARGGGLWLRDERGAYRNVAAWHNNRVDSPEPADTGLIRFLEDRGAVINVMAIDSRADEYEGLDLPAWLTAIHRPWLIVPLPGLESLLGFAILTNPLIVRPINWEDRDLLITAAKQVSSHLTVLMTSDALAEAKQFEVYNRLSAYMVHDLKNIAAELDLVARNATRHKTSPAFLEDAFATVTNAAGDIKRLLDQLRNKRVETEKTVVVELGPLLGDVLARKQGRFPRPRLDRVGEGLFVAAEKTRLANVLAHLIDNAQEATPEDGAIDVTLNTEGDRHIIQIRDNGHGMDADFVRHRLFKPFDTTKGNAGMGIGMYESREFIRGLGGEIHVMSEPGRGTVVSLYIPASLEPAVPVSITA